MSIWKKVTTQWAHLIACTCLGLLLLLSGCGRHQLLVARMVNPTYPTEAMLKGVEGTAKIDVLIAADGSVVAASGSGTSPILVEAAKQNARKWVFGPLPAHARFPLEHEITYTFRLEGKPKYVGIAPTIITDLPNRVEIIGTPMTPERTELIPTKPAERK